MATALHMWQSFDVARVAREGLMTAVLASVAAVAPQHMLPRQLRPLVFRQLPYSN